MHDRAECLNMLRQLGVKPRPLSSVAEWRWLGYADVKALRTEPDRRGRQPKDILTHTCGELRRNLARPASPLSYFVPLSRSRFLVRPLFAISPTAITM